jgi:surfeit locus 1 family protein
MSRDHPPRLWPIIVATAVGTAILLSLGAWQVKRLAWKEALIAQLEAKALAAPVSLPRAVEIAAQGEDPEFMRVAFTGRYLHDSWKKMITTYDGGQGWTIITPAVSDDGWAVMVDRGRLPDNRLKDFARPGGEVTIEGVIRAYRGGKGTYDPENDPAANLWYWWDVPAMLAASSLPAGAKPFPYVLQLAPGEARGEFPRPDAPKAKLANNHLGYAITWFGLAATLLAVAGFYIRELRKRQKPPLDDPSPRG